MTQDKINYFQGTQRVISPEETIKKTESKLKTAGITRVTEITHLDRLKFLFSQQSDPPLKKEV